MPGQVLDVGRRITVGQRRWRARSSWSCCSASRSWFRRSRISGPVLVDAQPAFQLLGAAPLLRGRVPLALLFAQEFKFLL
jgi:hypothetical protein